MWGKKLVLVGEGAWKEKRKLDTILFNPLLAAADLWDEGRGNGTQDKPPAPILTEKEGNKKAISSVLKGSAGSPQL